MSVTVCVLGNTSEVPPTWAYHSMSLRQLPDSCLSFVGDAVLITVACIAVHSLRMITVSAVFLLQPPTHTQAM